MFSVLTSNLGCLGRQPPDIYRDVALSLINSLRMFVNWPQTILKRNLNEWIGTVLQAQTVRLWGKLKCQIRRILLDNYQLQRPQIIACSSLNVILTQSGALAGTSRWAVFERPLVAKLQLSLEGAFQTMGSLPETAEKRLQQLYPCCA